jgi:hypothetical protein
VVNTAPTTRKYENIGIRIGYLQPEVQRQGASDVPVPTLKRAIEKESQAAEPFPETDFANGARLSPVPFDGLPRAYCV